MKFKFILASLLLLSASAMANPFDSFVGEYSLEGAPVIEKSGSARECVRFAFGSLVAFSVKAETGHQQTHMLYFHFKGTMGSGWMGHPVGEYFYQSEIGRGGSFAKTTGGQNFARNELNTWSNDESRPLVVSVLRNGERYQLEVLENLVESTRTLASCRYLANLQLKQ